MGMRICQDMKDGGELVKGIIEMEETYLGSKPRKSNVRRTEYEKDTFNKRGRGLKRLLC